MPKYKVIIFFEHVDREYEFAVFLAKKLKKAFPRLHFIIASIYFHQDLLLQNNIVMVFFPSYRWISGIFKNDLIKLNEKPTVFSLNYEQMLSTLNMQAKKPVGSFVKKNIYHFSWSKEFNEYLIQNGVRNQNIIQTQKYVYQIMSEKRFKSRIPNLIKTIRYKYKKIVFIPLTDIQAFKNKTKLKKAFHKKNDYKLALRSVDFFKNNIMSILEIILLAAEKYSDYAFILRPHPSVTPIDYEREFIFLKNSKVSNLYFNYSDSAYEWILATDCTVSNYSSLLLDAKYFNVPHCLLVPNKIPRFLMLTWFSKIKQIHSLKDFSLYLNKINKVINKKLNYDAQSSENEILASVLKIANNNKKILSNHKEAFQLSDLNFRILLKSMLLRFLKNYATMFLPDKYKRDLKNILVV